MADSNSSKDTQEEKPRRHSIKNRYGTMDWPSCLKLDVRREKQRARSAKDPKGNVMLSCMKVMKDKGLEEPTCPSYTCISGPTRRNCSAISSIQTYHPLQCPKAGQAGGATWGKKLQLESLKCWAKSTEDPRKIDLCCSPKVLEKVTLKEMKKVLAPKKQKLSAVDPQEAMLDYQTPKTPRHHRTFPRTSRRSREWRNLGSPTPMLDHPTPTHIPLCLGTSPDYQHPGLGQESSQGWGIAMVVVVGLVFLGVLVVLGMRWWRGQREEWCSCKKALRVEEWLRKGEDGVGGTPWKFWGSRGLLALLRAGSRFRVGKIS